MSEENYSRLQLIDNYDLVNSNDLVMTTIRGLKHYLIEKVDKVTNFKNPNKLPKGKELNEITSNEKTSKVLDDVVAHWKEEAYREGYLTALKEIQGVLIKTGL
jgi:hypothetical protein